METFQTMQDAMKLLTLFSQSETEIAKGKTVRLQDLLDPSSLRFSG